MMIRRKEIPFENPMTRTQSILGWIYLPLHVAVIPWLLGLYQSYSPDPMTNGTLNLVYYGIGVVFCLTVMYSFLRGGYDVLADAPVRCLGAMLMALLIDYALSGAAALVFSVLYFVIRRTMKFKDIMESLPDGFKAMVPAILILVCAWSLKNMTDSLGAKIFISQLVEGSAGGFQMFLLGERFFQLNRLR